VATERLTEQHRPEAIRERLAARARPSYLADAVLGGIDGSVTTFAVVAGAFGAGFSNLVVIVLGFANLLADGFSMAVSNYQSTKSRRQEVETARGSEARHIDEVPEGEREEIRQIFARKGFHGDVLDRIVDGITQDRRLWIDTMVTEELGMQVEGAPPLRSAVATFCAFLMVGFIPMVPFLIPRLNSGQRFLASAIATGVAFFTIGWVKGVVLERSRWRAGFETLLTGGAAAALAYFTGEWLRAAFGA
jgi:VIT1/CCC1 family predicted Fe2+/Mn2+ transporter